MNRTYGTSGKDHGNGYGACGHARGLHFYVHSLGCGYYEARTRADVWGVSRPIHKPETRMGTTFGRCAGIAQAAERRLRAALTGAG